MLAFLLVTLVLVHTPPTFTIDDKIKPYTEEVVKLSKDNLKGVNPVLVKVLPGKEIGRCYYRTIRHIEIDYESFKYYNHKEKIAIMAHEMMHFEKTCPHNDKLLKDGCHESLMHSTMQRRSCYEKHWDRYTKEMQEIDC